MRKAFTMIELTFVIVIIGILAAIALPKFTATRDDATITKAKTTLASVRSAITQEAQRRQMEGNYTQIFSLTTTVALANNVNIFDHFDGNPANPRVLNYPIQSCKTSSSTGCWVMTQKGSSNGNVEKYSYTFPKAVFGTSATATFLLQGNRFVCDTTTPSNYCDALEH